MPELDLSLVPLETLLHEVYTRYDACVFAGLRSTTDADEEAEFGYAGGVYTGLGLALGLRDYLLGQRALHELEAADDDDEGAL